MAKWIQKAIKRPGAFRQKARRAGKSVMAYARAVIRKRKRNPRSVSLRTYRQALLALTLSRFGKKRED